MKIRKTQILGVGFVAAVGAAGAALAISSCAAAPIAVPVRTFELPKKVDVVCIAVNNPADGGPLAAAEIHGLVQSECAPIATDFAALNATTTTTLPNHLYAVVTQTARGELAVVDLTAGNVVDEDRSTPGTNFIPVGSIPTDVVVAPDGLMTFVASADPNKPAIYAIPTNPHSTSDGGLAGALLGDSAYLSGQPIPLPLLITDLEACALPQTPQALVIAPIANPDGGASNSYALIAVLAPVGAMSAKVVAIDPTSLLRAGGVDAGSSDAAAVTPGILAPCTPSIVGAIPLSGAVPSSWSAGPAWPDGVPYAEAGSFASQEPSAGPTCASSVTDGGALGAPAPVAADAGDVGDAGATGEAGDNAGTAIDGGQETDGGTLPLTVSAGAAGQPFPSQVALREDLPILYIGDGALPLIHVIDLTDPTHPRELAPLLATSITQPTRQVSVGAIAISPTTRDFRRYLYAVDQGEGTLMVYDVTDPALSPRTPLQRPHAELNPLLPQDRLGFSAPVATVGFVQHDWPLIPPGPNGTANPDQIHAYEGLLCNPNPNAHPDGGAFADLGAYYRVDQALAIQAAGTVSTVQGFPYRLRGIFGFATLSNGEAVAIDVDDWDAPCRRPDPMTMPNPAKGPSYGMTGLLDIPEPPAGPPGSSTYLDPYHAPLTYQADIPESPAVTQEVFFPVSAPNRMRSNYLLRNDPTSGLHIPNLVGAPQLFDAVGAPVSGSATVAPLILPTVLPATFVDPTLNDSPTEADPSSQNSLPAPATFPSSKATPSVRLSFDDPTVTTDQDWTVTYEGALPAGQQSAADIDTTDGYQTLRITIGVVGEDGGLSGSGVAAITNGPGFCERGVEDLTLGQARAALADSATQMLQGRLPDGGVEAIPAAMDRSQWTADYIEIIDDILVQGDPYWSVPYSSGGQIVNGCWAGTGSVDVAGKTLSLDDDSGDPNIANDRYNACQETFAPPLTDPDSYLTRDFPILHAYDDHLIVGRFGWTPTDSKGNGIPESTNNRVVVGPNAGNAPFLKFMQCCFHHQAAFKVRTGGEWVTVGQTGLGFLHHVIAAPPGTDPLNPTSRPCVLSCDPQNVLLNARSFDIPWGVPPACVAPGTFSGISRNSPLAMQNPYLSFVTWSGCGDLTGGNHTLTARDQNWKFSVRGGFSPLMVSITGNTTTAVSPQSMKFIESFGQLAIVDGELQGLVLIDLNTLAFAHNPYY